MTKAKSILHVEIIDDMKRKHLSKSTSIELKTSAYDVLFMMCRAHNWDYMVPKKDVKLSKSIKAA